jgi:hypothetical protein
MQYLPSSAFPLGNDLGIAASGGKQEPSASAASASLEPAYIPDLRQQNRRASGEQHRESISAADKGVITPRMPDNLRENRLLWYKLHVFMYDLRNFRSNKASRTRLDAVISLDYIGQPYFSDDEAQTLRNTIVEGGSTLQEALDSFFRLKLPSRLQSRAKSEYDYRVCAAHDVAPVLEKAFGVKEGDLKRNKEFVKLVRKRGLDLVKGEVWLGVGSKARR